MLRLWQLSQVWTWWCWSSPPTTSHHLSSWWAEPAVHHFLGGTMARRLEWFVRSLESGSSVQELVTPEAGWRLGRQQWPVGARAKCGQQSEHQWDLGHRGPSGSTLFPPVTQPPWQGKALAWLSSCERWWQWGEVEWRHKEVAVNLVFHQQEVVHNSITSFCLSEMIAEKYLIWAIWSHRVTILAQKGNI